MPLTEKGETIKKSLVEEYGKEKGTSILYAGKNKGTFTGIDSIGGRRRFTAAFRDCTRKGMSFDQALASSLASTTSDADPPGIRRDTEGKFTSGGGGHYTGHAISKGGKTLHTTTGHASHEAAAKAALAEHPNAKSVSTGRGYNGSFDIRYHRPDQVRSYKTHDAEESIAGAREVVHSVLGLHHELAGAAGTHKGGNAKPAVHNVHGAGKPSPAPHAPKAPAVTAVVTPKVPSAPKAPTAATPKVTAPTTPKTGAPYKGYGGGTAPAKTAAPKAPAAPKASAPPAPPAPRAMSPQVKKPPTKDSTMRVYHKDAAARFRATVRDAVRENMPLPKVMELGVISGTASNEKTPDSEGTEYKPTKDAFTAAFRDAVSKGVSTTDALRAALKG